MYLDFHLKKEEIKNNRIQRRVYELLSKVAAGGPSHPIPNQRELHFVFFRKPDRFLGSTNKFNHVTGVRFEKTALKGSFYALSNTHTQTHTHTYRHKENIFLKTIAKMAGGSSPSAHPRVQNRGRKKQASRP